MEYPRIVLGGNGSSVGYYYYGIPSEVIPLDQHDNVSIEAIARGSHIERVAYQPSEEMRRKAQQIIEDRDNKMREHLKAYKRNV